MHTFYSAEIVITWYYNPVQLLPASSQDTDLSCHLQISTFCFTIWSQSTNVTDGRRDRQTDVMSLAYTRHAMLYSCMSLKKVKSVISHAGVYTGCSSPFLRPPKSVTYARPTVTFPAIEHWRPLTEAVRASWCCSQVGSVLISYRHEISRTWTYISHVNVLSWRVARYMELLWE